MFVQMEMVKGTPMYNDDFIKNSDKTHKFWENSKFTELVGNNDYYSRVETLLEEFAEKNITKDMTLLDIGCGNGRYTKILSKYCKKIIGYDLSKPLIQENNEKNDSANIEYKLI